MWVKLEEFATGEISIDGPPGIEVRIKSQNSDVAVNKLSDTHWKLSDSKNDPDTALEAGYGMKPEKVASVEIVAPPKPVKVKFTNLGPKTTFMSLNLKEGPNITDEEFVWEVNSLFEGGNYGRV